MTGSASVAGVGILISFDMKVTSQFLKATSLRRFYPHPRFVGVFRVSMNCIGFYWTLPVNWAGFTTLPADADEAAKISRTIRYQVERVRHWVKTEGGTLLREVVYLETRPDRGTAAIGDDLRLLVTTARKLGAKVVLVDFSQAYGWRSHGYLHDLLSDSDLCRPLTPDEWMIDGKRFDPVTHFRTWREVDEAYQSTKPQLKAAAQQTISGLKEAGASYAAIATELNVMGVRTVNGLAWTAENVRKFMAQG